MIDNVLLGDKADLTYLDACKNWMQSILEKPNEYKNFVDYNLNKLDLIKKFYNFDSHPMDAEASIITYDGFNSDYTIIGMSSLDGIILIATNHPDGLIRFVWRNLSGNIGEKIIQEKIVNDVMMKTVGSFMAARSSFT